MTYIVGLVAPDGIILASDSLIKQAGPGAQAPIVRTDLPKLFTAGSHMSFGFAGVVTNIRELVDGFQNLPAPDSEPTKPYRDVANITNGLHTNAIHRSARAIAQYQSDIEIIAGGYNLDSKGRPLDPIIVYKNSRISPLLRPISYSGLVEAGYKPTEDGFAHKLYEASGKNGDLRLIAIQAVTRAMADNPDWVGGNILLHHITKLGIATGIINPNK